MPRKHSTTSGADDLGAPTSHLSLRGQTDNVGAPSRRENTMTKKLTDLEGRLEAAMKRADKPTHTPGPWTATEGRNGFGDFLNYVFKDGKMVASLNLADGDTTYQRGITQANARLIAAAPELLAALKLAELELTSLHETKGLYFTGLLETLRAAIAKAEGR